MAKVKKAAANIAVPQSDAEAASFVRTIGDRQRELLRLTADHNDQVAALQEKLDHAAGPIADSIAALTEGVRIYAEANRDRLTGGGKVKFHRFATGEINWRLRPAKVTIRGAEEVIQLLKKAGLTRFIRTKEEVNKDAMLASKEDRELANGIKGVTIGSDGEDFSIEPAEAEAPAL